MLLITRVSRHEGRGLVGGVREQAPSDHGYIGQAAAPIANKPVLFYGLAAIDADGELTDRLVIESGAEISGSRIVGHDVEVTPAP